MLAEADRRLKSHSHGSYDVRPTAGEGEHVDRHKRFRLHITDIGPSGADMLGRLLQGIARPALLWSIGKSAVTECMGEYKHELTPALRNGSVVPTGFGPIPGFPSCICRQIGDSA